MNRRNFTRILAAAALAPSLSLPKAASAKLYNGPIRVVVGFPPGGATDVVARTILDRLSQALGGQVLVGAPDTIAERLRMLQEEIGIDGILAEINCGGLIPHEQVMTALRLLCEEVKPRFH